MFLQQGNVFYYNIETTGNLDMTPTERQQLLVDHKIFISCIVPVFNEEPVIESFVHKLEEELKSITQHYEIILIDDGSSDDTVKKIMELPPSPSIKLLALSRNFGKEAALTAGLEYSTGDVALLIDADFQHPVTMIVEFLKYWAQGYDMVYGVRSNRDDESFLKRNFSRLFYGLMAKISRINIPSNAGDFRLLDKKVVVTLNSIEERGRFMKGLYAWVGYKSVAVPFEVQKRAAGASSWKFSRLTELALTGITLFSDIPLRIWSLVGFTISLIAFLYALYIVTVTMISGVDVPGFATLVVAIMFFGGIQLLSIGILGEYIARIFNEVKRRPKYIVEKKLGFDQ